MKPRITEAEFTAQVIQYAKLHGWRCAHFRPGRTAKGWRTAVQGDGKGFPDLVLAKGERLIFAELKKEGGKTSPEQQTWCHAILSANQEFYLWRPSDWPEIERILGGAPC